MTQNGAKPEGGRTEGAARAPATPPAGCVGWAAADGRPQGTLCTAPVLRAPIFVGRAMLGKMSADLLDMQFSAMRRTGTAPRQPSAHSSHRHNLANHGSLPDLDDVQELLVYLTLLFIVLSWMMREIHIAFFTTGKSHWYLHTLARGQRRPIPVRYRPH